MDLRVHYNRALFRVSVKKEGVMPMDGTVGHFGVRTLVSAVLLALLATGCQPTVKVETPTEPITINLNIKLDADVRLKVEQEAEVVIDSNPDIF
jgi:hypothetical protein